MFRCDEVHNIHGLVLILDDEELSVLFNGFGSDVLARQFFQLAPDFGFDFAGKGGAGRDQEDCSPAVVFGLGQEVRSDPYRVGIVVGQDADFTGTGNHVNADGAEDQALSHGHVSIAGTDDLKDWRNAFCTVSSRGNALGTADFIDFRSAGDMGRSQDVGIDRTVFGRRREDGDGRDAGDVGRDGVHEDRRRVGSRAAGNVDADALDWRELGPQADAGTEGINPGLFDLPFMISPDVGGRFFEDGHEIGTDDVDGGVDFFRRNEETVQIHAIEALRIFPDSCVAALFDIGQDGFDGFSDVFTFCLIAFGNAANVA